MGFKMNVQSKYEKELAAFESSKTRAMARVDKMIAEGKARLKEKEQLSKKQGLSATNGMTSKFGAMKKQIEIRSATKIKELTTTSQKTIQKAKAKLADDMRKFKKALALAKTEQSQGKKGAEIMMGESKSD